MNTVSPPSMLPLYPSVDIDAHVSPRLICYYYSLTSQILYLFYSCCAQNMHKVKVINSNVRKLSNEHNGGKLDCAKV